LEEAAQNIGLLRLVTKAILEAYTAKKLRPRSSKILGVFFSDAWRLQLPQA
jgi:hypothetical protein